MSYSGGNFKGKKRDNGGNDFNKAKETLQEVLEYPIKGYRERNIYKVTMERFGVRCSVSEQDGETVTAFYFPSYNKKGAIVGFKKQDLSKSKEETGHWTTVGSVGIGNKLFGQDVSESVQRLRKDLIVTEGEWDALSAYQSCTTEVAGTKYEGLEPFVCSIPMGTGNAVESLLHNAEFVKSFQSLCVFFDNDFCTPAEKKKGILKGHEAREAVAGAFVGTGITLYSITAEHGYKDASDYMQIGKVSELAKLVTFGKKVFSAEKIVKASEVSLEDIIKPRPEGIYVPEFPKLMDKIHGLRKRELLLITSPTGVGKSTISGIFANSILNNNEKVGMIFLEETVVETVQRFIASKLKVNYLEFKNNPLSCASKEEIKKYHDEIVLNDNIVLLDHFGSMPISELMNKIRHLHFVEGCDYIFLDHLSMVISGSDVTDERKELDIVMTELGAFCAGHNVGIVVVAHINRTAAELFKTPKGSEDKPFWVKITKEMLRGSASLEQISFIILALEPEIKPDRSRGGVRFVVLKNRPWSILGVADEFTMNENTWEVITREPEVQNEFS